MIALRSDHPQPPLDHPAPDDQAFTQAPLPPHHPFDIGSTALPITLDPFPIPIFVQII
jgi:hypothetical protein